LDIYAKEIDTAMGLCGLHSIDDISADVLANPPGN
jgi:isopentenyl diphosphate isomerase/L-lactate dehydrogenase-like FMN-dependent dehydrogenase